MAHNLFIFQLFMLRETKNKVRLKKSPAFSVSVFVFLFQTVPITPIFFVSNQSQASALKVAYIFKVFGAQSCLMVAQQFNQITYVYKECNNFQDSKLIFMIGDFRIFPIMLLRQLNCDVSSTQQLCYVDCKGKTPLFSYLQFLLLLSEKGLSPESCLAICHPRA